MIQDEQRIKQFHAWEKLLSQTQVKIQNRFHERTESRHKLHGYSRGASLRGPLKAEIDAWEEASDEAFESFEESLG